jgi:hypothetical protein
MILNPTVSKEIIGFSISICLPIIVIFLIGEAGRF